MLTNASFPILTIVHVGDMLGKDIVETLNNEAMLMQTKGKIIEMEGKKGCLQLR